MMLDHSDRYELSVNSELIDQEQDYEQSMSEHASPEGSNMQLEEGSANEIENAELLNNNN